MASGFAGIFLVATNPVDILTYAVGNFPACRGSVLLVLVRFLIQRVFVSYWANILMSIHGMCMPILLENMGTRNCLSGVV